MDLRHPNRTSSSGKLRATSLKQLFGYLKAELPLFVAAMLALSLASGINLLFPEVIRRLLNQSNLASLTEHWVIICFGLVALFAIQALAFYFRALLFGQIGQRIVAKIRQQIFENIIFRNIQFHDMHNSNDLVSRISNDAQMLQDALSIKLSVLIRYTFQVIIGLALMIVLSLGLTLTILLIVPLLVGISIGLAKRLRKYSRLQQTELGQALNIAQESFSGARVVKAFNLEERITSRFNLVNSKILALGVERSKISAFFQSFVSFLMNVAIVFVLFLGIYLVDTSRLEVGDLTAFLLYGAIVAVSFSFVAAAISELAQSLGASDRISDLLLDVPIKPKAPAPNSAYQIKHVCFDKVDFFYPARPDVKVLDAISFNLAQGSTTAIVGMSGAGKSSIAQLLLGFYAPSAGNIKVNGEAIDIENDLTYRSKVSFVPQEQIFLSTTIRENVLYGNWNASEEELRTACEQANILGFIDSLPEGFNTFVGERGVQLSVGQKQRLAIARAIISKPELIVLDEATSALDSESEHQVQEALNKVLKGRTAVVIAHRLSTIRDAQQILVMDEGRVVQVGTHEQLRQAAGLYSQLVDRQELSAPSAA